MALRRTNQGKLIDLEAEVSKLPESKPAVGNMNVNARGDIIDSKGNIVTPSHERVRAYYKDHPQSSQKRVSLKSKMSEETPSVPGTEPKTAKTAKENKRVEKVDTTQEDTDDDYREIEHPNGDIEIVKKHSTKKSSTAKRKK